MTIAVTIDNTDMTHTIEVLEKNYDKERMTSDVGPPFALGPGMKRTFYCYHLRDLIIREQNSHPHS